MATVEELGVHDEGGFPRALVKKGNTLERGPSLESEKGKLGSHFNEESI